MNTSEEAQEYFEALVTRHMNKWGDTREKAEECQRSNLGYYSGYYSYEMQVKVERLFNAVHPIFGSINNSKPLTVGQIIEMGIHYGESEQS